MFVSSALLLYLPILISVAMLTLLERKLLSIVGSRLGPNKVSLQGILQPIGDAVKLASKQSNNLSWSYTPFYYISSFGFFIGSLVMWYCFFTPSVVSFKMSLLVFFLVLSLNSLVSIISGWSTFGKYSIIGSLRSVAQLVSYEASLYFCLFFVLSFYCSFSISSFDSSWPWAMVVPLVLMIWTPTFLAELNRTPYDFSEGESELVSGFNVDFGSLGFTLIFLGEYSNICFFCLLTPFLFFSYMSLSYSLLCFIFVIWIRSVLPRYRFDKLMNMCWKIFIPILTFYFICMFIFLL